MWRGWTSFDQANRYGLHYRSEFVSLTFFDDLDAVRSFAGSDYETAVVAEEAREVLIRFDGRVCHTKPRLKPDR
jgi:hypothetical protein